MITEDYCTYEVSKLLKEKEFDEFTIGYFFAEKGSQDYTFCCSPTPYKYNIDSNQFIASPTHQMAMKWLREKHNICISVYAAAFRHGFTIDKEDTGSFICNEDVMEADPMCMDYTYEQAVEAALKYALEKLIKL